MSTPWGSKRINVVGVSGVCGVSSPVASLVSEVQWRLWCLCGISVQWCLCGVSGACGVSSTFVARHLTQQAPYECAD